jgi:predicted permease
MPAADIGEIFAAAVTGMATILLISAVGVCLALRPTLPRPVLHADALRQLSRLLVTMCWPAMAFYGVGKALDSKSLANLWPLLVVPLLNMLLGWAATMVMCKLMRTEARLTPALVVSGTFGNAAALPLVLLSALCRQPILADIDNCDNRSLAYIMVYTIPWSITFFIVAMPWLRNVAKPPETNAGAESSTFGLLGLKCNCASWKLALATGPMAGTVMGVLCALWPSLQDNLFNTPSVLRPGVWLRFCLSRCVSDSTIVPHLSYRGVWWCACS